MSNEEPQQQQQQQQPVLNAEVNPTEFENKYVHEVYEAIAPHFSATRYRAWPSIVRFLNEETSPHALICDIGCGNGKYLKERPNKNTMIGMDYSASLIRMVKAKGYEVLEGNCMALPFRDCCFDAAISIAVLHHMSTEERRLHCLKEMIRILHIGGKLCLYVWSIEQGGDRRKLKRGLQQTPDAYIPWKMHKRFRNVNQEVVSDSKGEQGKFETASNEFEFQRYYRLFTEQELKDLCNKVDNVVIEQVGFDHQNWFVVLKKTKHV